MSFFHLAGLRWPALSFLDSECRFHPLKMQSINKLNVGLFGYGVVGSAVYEVLNHTPSLESTIKKICIKHPDKKRDLPASFFTTNRHEILDDESINVVIEMTDDAEAAFEITCQALKKGKAVISANKKMIAGHLQDLIEIQQSTGNPLLYESACCASIPVIRNLEEYYDNDLLRGLRGIINGSTNFILSNMFETGISYGEALAQAQANGFAESDPKLDVEGFDALNKLCILLVHAYGILSPLDQLLHHGIHRITNFDRDFAISQKCQIKLVAQAVKLNNEEVAAFVLPQFVKSDDLLHRVHNEFNGVVLTSTLADEQFFYGKGAGGFPTASAILSDLSALRYLYRYEYKKRLSQAPLQLADDLLLDVYVGFDTWEKVPVDAFESVQEYYSGKQHHYRRGIVSLKKLRTADWWRQEGVSLILHDVVGKAS